MSTAVAMALFMDGVRVCPYCGEPFVPKPGKAKAYCTAAHGVNYRTATSRDRAKRGEAVVRANLDVSTSKLLERLAEAGIERERGWVVKAKARLQLEDGKARRKITKESLR
jgi:hypothetical protein